MPCDLKQCSIRVNVMAWYTVSTAGTNGLSKHYHVMGIFLPGSCNLPVFNFFPFGLFDWFSKAIETARNQLVKTTLAYLKQRPFPHWGETETRQRPRKPDTNHVPWRHFCSVVTFCWLTRFVDSFVNFDWLIYFHTNELGPVVQNRD